ncbi:MAG: ABC transporter ATP-binding protein [Anaerolineales bacterium]|nr:ABC transporter ATP-binding protein [Anaerolineales bacterium]
MSEQIHFEEEEFTSRFNGDTMWRVFRVAFKHWPFMVGFLLAISITAVLDSYFTYLSKRMIDEAIVPGDLDMLWSLVMQYGAFIFLQAFMVFVFIMCSSQMNHRVQYDLRQSMFNHLQKLSFSYYDRTPLGWLMSRITSDTSRVGELVAWGFLDITWGITNIGFALVFMYFINWRLAIIVTIMLPILILVANRFQSRILREYRLVRKLNSKITSSYSESITGVRVIKSIRREEENLREFGDLTGDMYNAGFKAAWLSALFLPAVQLISAGAIAGVVWVGGLQFENGLVTIGTIQAFISYITFMLWPVQEMARVYASMQQAVASAERIFSLLDQEPDIVDKADALDVSHIRGDIEFDHVDFYYEENKPVLRDFSLTVKRGETIALVGPTGAGKSTIVNLMCRFYEPRRGQIRIGGRDYTNLTLHAIQSRIGMVLQTPHLFSGTVMENLGYGRLNASDEEVVEAAKMAGAHEFITHLDKGYETEVGEGGVLLSVGQKQLLSLARAILAKPDIFIMDEATSSVDTLTEALIQQAMDRIMEGRTSFVIAHRLSTIKRADRIIVLKDGQIDEIGSHAELIRQRGHYYDLYTKQFRRERAVELETVDGSGDAGAMPLAA